MYSPYIHILLSPYTITSFFFFNDTPTTEIYTLSYTTLFRSRKGELPPHSCQRLRRGQPTGGQIPRARESAERPELWRSEEHTSELQSHHDLVCRLLLEKKKKTPKDKTVIT